VSPAVAWAIDAVKGSGLPSSARLVLIIAATYADRETGANIRPSVGRLAGDCGLGKTTVHRCLRELTDAGLLLEDGRVHRGVRRYRLKLPPIQNLNTSDRPDAKGTYSESEHNPISNRSRDRSAASLNSGTEDREGVEDRRAALLAGQAVVVNPTAGHADAELVAWAMERGLLVNVDRSSRWGNPYRSPFDGDRDRVVDRYRDELIPSEPKLMERLPELQGKALACRSYPRKSHADLLAVLANSLPPRADR
jgi:hypothetical protein